MNIFNLARHTQSKSFCATWLNNKGKHSNQRKEAVWHDEMNNVIQVSATQVYYEGRT